MTFDTVRGYRVRASVSLMPMSGWGDTVREYRVRASVSLMTMSDWGDTVRGYRVRVCHRASAS